MTLATRCPWCETVFRITKEQVAVRGGMARCGACGRPFNALDQLVEDKQLSRLGAAPAGIRIMPHTGAPAPVDAGTTLAPQAPAQTTQSFAPVRTIERATDPLESASDDMSDPGQMIGETRSLPSFLASARAERHVRPRSGWLAWTLLSLLGIAALTAQAAYIWRDDLAMTYPQIKPYFVQVCNAIGCKIVVPRRIDSISIESSELQAVPNSKDALQFVALLRSHGTVAVRYPAIELVLTDAQDRVALRRTILPETYLLATQRAHLSDGLAPNSELPIRLLIDAPTLKIQGYRTGLFYP